MPIPIVAALATKAAVAAKPLILPGLAAGAGAIAGFVGGGLLRPPPPPPVVQEVVTQPVIQPVVSPVVQPITITETVTEHHDYSQVLHKTHVEHHTHVQHHAMTVVQDSPHARVGQATGMVDAAHHFQKPITFDRQVAMSPHVGVDVPIRQDTALPVTVSPHVVGATPPASDFPWLVALAGIAALALLRR